MGSASTKLVTDPARRLLMQRVRQQGTPAELKVAKLCREIGLRYRLNVRTLPGSPDLANKSAGWAIFVHGCFWHRHPGCSKATTPKRNAQFWLDKFAANRARDSRNAKELRVAGYKVVIVWECETARPQQLKSRLKHSLSRRRRVEQH